MGLRCTAPSSWGIPAALPTVAAVPRAFCHRTIPPWCRPLPPHPLLPARYMESFETKHSNHSLAAGIAEEIGLELPSLRLDSQAKYGALSRGDASIFM